MFRNQNHHLIRTPKHTFCQQHEDDICITKLFNDLTYFCKSLRRRTTEFTTLSLRTSWVDCIPLRPDLVLIISKCGAKHLFCQADGTNRETRQNASSSQTTSRRFCYFIGRQLIHAKIIERTINKLINQSVNESINRSSNRLINQPINRWTK